MELYYFTVATQYFNTIGTGLKWNCFSKLHLLHPSVFFRQRINSCILTWFQQLLFRTHQNFTTWKILIEEKYS